MNIIIARPTIHQFKNLRIFQEMLKSSHVAALYFDHLESSFRFGRGNKGDPITFDLVEYLAQLCWVSGFGLLNRNIKYDPSLANKPELIIGFGTEFIAHADSIQKYQININMNNNAFFTPGEFRNKHEFTKQHILAQFCELSSTIDDYIGKIEDPEYNEFEDHFAETVRVIRRPRMVTRSNMKKDTMLSLIATFDASLNANSKEVIFKDSIAFYVNTDLELTSLSLHYRMRGFRVIARRDRITDRNVIEIF